MNKTKTYYGEYSLKHWIDLMLAKNIVLPDYQRSFVWDESKTRSLMKSFKDEEFVPPVVIAAVCGKNNKESNIILDGQQRLTSILLAYLGYFPLKEKFKLEQKQIADENDNINDDDELVSNEMMDWQFSVLLNGSSSFEEIKEKLCTDSAYKKIDLGNITEDFLGKRFMGFSYLVPESKDIKSQQHYYSTAFRNINIKGSPLLPTESRKALYYLDSTLEPFFEPKFCNNITVRNQNAKLDFIRYVSILSQYEYYKKSEKYKNKSAQIFSQLVKGYSRRIENFYEDYIYFVTDSNGDSGEKKFIKFSELFSGGTKECESCLKKLERIITDFKFPKIYDSIIDLDVYFFGLIYTILFKKASIDMDNAESLKEELNQAIAEFKEDERHSRSPAGFKYLRKRIETSLEIYSSYENN